MKTILLSQDIIKQIIIEENCASINDTDTIYFYSIADIIEIIENQRKTDLSHKCIDKVRNKKTILQEIPKDKYFVPADIDENVLSFGVFQQSDNESNIEFWKYSNDVNLTPFNNISLISLKNIDYNWNTSFVDEYLERL